MTEYFEISGIFLRFSVLTRRIFRQFSVNFPTNESKSKAAPLGLDPMPFRVITYTNLALRHTLFLFTGVSTLSFPFSVLVYLFTTVSLHHHSVYHRQYNVFPSSVLFKPLSCFLHQYFLNLCRVSFISTF